MASDVNGRARIVVVDDEPSITDAVSTALGYEGFDVEQVHGGRDALEVVSDLRPDLVVLDIMLPDIDGVTLLKRLRQDGVNVPVLLGWNPAPMIESRPLADVCELPAASVAVTRITALRLGAISISPRIWRTPRMKSMTQRISGSAPGSARTLAVLG